jgi:hypothetical protein
LLCAARQADIRLLGRAEPEDVSVSL